MVENDISGVNVSQNPCTSTLPFRNDEYLNESIAEITEFDDKDTTHFVAMACNTLVASVSAYELLPHDAANPLVRFAGVPAVAAVMIATWQYDELNMTLFGGVLIAAARVLRELYRFGNQNDLVWSLFKTWIISGGALLALVLLAASPALRQKIKRKQRRRKLQQKARQSAMAKAKAQ